MMDNRGFVPFGGGFGGGGFGGGFRPPFRPFPHPFFPGRFLYPFFFFSPFFFPFIREDDRNYYYAHHQVQTGDTMEQIAHAYNIPGSLLEEANLHIANPKSLKHGETVVIPRISNMYCHKTYMDMPSTQSLSQAQPNAQPNAVSPNMVSPNMANPNMHGASVNGPF
ncbi:LysM domain-containing protein [Paenibacillus glycanilyticus]|uniref:LysM peptidoglycan-binding domain-containing protein n=1 Tax=Paenibacillus glycanilyticus TaxID=126569 RepID=UPI0020406EA2|nr:LysM domain-containing protein [Paenibacillus glycanilyticus]MCM3628632.1 LysM domain-containing protein [Paenibacillus glycanilyticus]